MSYIFYADPQVNGEMPLGLYFMLGTGPQENGEMPLGETYPVDRYNRYNRWRVLNRFALNRVMFTDGLAWVMNCMYACTACSMFSFSVLAYENHIQPRLTGL